MALEDILRELKIPLSVIAGGAALIGSIYLFNRNSDPTGVNGKEKAFKTATIVLENVAKMDSIFEKMGYVRKEDHKQSQQPIIIYTQPSVQPVQPGQPVQPDYGNNFYPQIPDNSKPDAEIIPADLDY